MTESEFIEILEQYPYSERARLADLARRFNTCSHLKKHERWNIRAMKRQRLKELGKR